MISTMAKIVRNGQLTIPSRIRKLLNLHDGDLVKFTLEEKHLVITPVAVVNKDQEYFYSKGVQGEIKLSEESVKKGKVKKYTKADSLIKELGLEDA
jgi:antitoxin MazE